MVIQHNISSLNALRNTNLNNDSVSDNLEKLSSGFRINRAADDAAGLAISEKMRGQIRGLGMAQQNVKHGINLIQTAEGGLNEITAILGRVRELSVQAANGTYADEDRANIDLEIQQLISEVSSTAEKTHYNNIPLLTPQTIVIPPSITAPTTPPTTPSITTDTPLDSIAEKITSQSDIVFAIDISGSMSNSIRHVIDNIKDFVDNVPAGSRVSILLYSDLNVMFSGSVEEMKYFDFTSNPDDIKDYLDSIQMYGGGDWEESGLEAIVEAVDKLKPSSEEKHLIFITDAPSHTKDGTGLSEYTLEQVNQLLKDEGIIFHGIGPTFGTGYDQIVALVDGTGGNSYDVSVTQGSDYVPNPSDPTVTHIVIEMVDVVLQIGANNDAGDSLTIKLNDMRAEALGITGINIKTPTDASDAIQKVDDALIKVLDKRAYFGAMQNRLEYTLNNLGVQAENLQSAESTIRDVDMAKEMMEFTKNNILAQAAQSMLAQANQLPQGVLSLLR